MNDSFQQLARFRARREAALERFLAQDPHFGVGSYRSSSRPGQVGRVVAPTRKQGVLRPHQAWKRRAGFVGQGSSTSMPGTPQAHPVGPPTPSGNPPPNGGCVQPPYPCPPTMDPRWWDFNRGCPIGVDASGCVDGVTMHCDTDQPCGVNVIGANTLGTEGIPPGEVVPLQVTAGDATKFRTKAIYFEALPYAEPDLLDVTALPPGRQTMPLILVDALVGRISQLRRGGSPDVGLTQGGYAELLRTTPAAIYDMVRRGRLPGVIRISRRILVDRAALSQWLEQHRSPTQGSPAPRR